MERRLKEISPFAKEQKTVSEFFEMASRLASESDTTMIRNGLTVLESLLRRKDKIVEAMRYQLGIWDRNFETRIICKI